jgi:hypothetical protein
MAKQLTRRLTMRQRLRAGRCRAGKIRGHARTRLKQKCGGASGGRTAAHRHMSQLVGSLRAAVRGWSSHGSANEAEIRREQPVFLTESLSSQGFL